MCFGTEVEDSCDTDYPMFVGVWVQKVLERLGIGEYHSAFGESGTEDAEGSVDEPRTFDYVNPT